MLDVRVCICYQLLGKQKRDTQNPLASKKHCLKIEKMGEVPPDEQHSTLSSGL